MKKNTSVDFIAIGGMMFGITMIISSILKGRLIKEQMEDARKDGEIFKALMTSPRYLPGDTTGFYPDTLIRKP